LPPAPEALGTVGKVVQPMNTAARQMIPPAVETIRACLEWLIVIELARRLAQTPKRRRESTTSPAVASSLVPLG
jgi:hypothetical protein